ncbi:MAG: hypothetical protein IJT49_03130 [Clostridia bacterium]|nr:hypothetical protein [Clostridia bacterium]
MKKVLAVILITVMIAALIPITSVATDKDPDTWLCDPSTEASPASAYWMDQTNEVWKANDYEFRVSFITPNAFDGFKMQSWGNASAVISLYGVNGLLEQQNYTNPGDALNDVRFSKAYAPGRYTIQIHCVAEFGKYLVIGTGATLSTSVWAFCDGNVEGAYTAPYIILTGAVNPEPDAAAPTYGYDYWLCEPLNSNGELDYTTGWWSSPYYGDYYYTEFTFNAPYAFDGMAIMIFASWAYYKISIFDDEHNLCETLTHRIIGDALTTIKFLRSYAPGRYSIRIDTTPKTYPGYTGSYLVIGSGFGGNIVVNNVGTANTNTNTRSNPYIMLTGGLNPDPTAVNSYDADTWLCTPNKIYEIPTGDPTNPIAYLASRTHGWWTWNNGNKYEIKVAFDTPNAFDSIITYFYGTGTVAISVIDAYGTVCETKNYTQLVEGWDTVIKLDNTYAPGHYTICFTREEAGDSSQHMLLASADAGNTKVTLSITNAMANENTHAVPYIGLMGAVNTDLKQPLYGGIARVYDDPTDPNSPTWGWWFYENAADTLTNFGADREVDITFTADCWFDRMMMSMNGNGTVNMELSTAEGKVVDNIVFSSPTSDNPSAFANFSRAHAPGKYVLKITAGEGLTDGSGNYFILQEGTVNADPRVTVRANVYRAASTTSPAITLMGAAEDQLELTLDKINASLMEGNLININFKANNALFADSDDDSTKVTFEIDGETKDVEGVVSGDQRVFTLAGLSPEQMDKTITATLKTSVGGIDKTAPVVSYTPQTYFETLINDPAQGTNVKALAAATLYYGAAAQAYASGTSTMTPADPAAIAARKATLTSVKALDGTNVVNKLASWTAVGLKLEDEVSIRYKFKLLDASVASSAKIYFTYGTTEKTVDLSDLTSIGNNVYVYYLPMPANLLSETVTAVIKEGDEAISSTFTYSVESYAYAKKDDADTTLADLVTAMMIYGDAAATYVANPDD